MSTDSVAILHDALVFTGTAAKPLKWSRAGDLQQLAVQGVQVDSVKKVSASEVRVTLTDGTWISVDDEGVYEALSGFLLASRMPPDLMAAMRGSGFGPPGMLQSGKRGFPPPGNDEESDDSVEIFKGDKRARKQARKAATTGPKIETPECKAQ